LSNDAIRGDRTHVAALDRRNQSNIEDRQHVVAQGTRVGASASAEARRLAEVADRDQSESCDDVIDDLHWQRSQHDPEALGRDPKRSARAGIVGEVRNDHHTSAPCSTRSVAISAPVLPDPTTSTRLPLYSEPLR